MARPAAVTSIARKIVEVRHGKMTLRVSTVSLKVPKKTSITPNNDLDSDEEIAAQTKRSAACTDGKMLNPNKSIPITPECIDTDDVKNKETEVTTIATGPENNGSKGNEKSRKRGRPPKNLTDVKTNKKSKSTIGLWEAGQRFQGIDSLTGKYLSGKITSSTGQAKGSNKDVYNVMLDQNGHQGCMDLSSINKLSVVPDNIEMLVLFNNNAVAEAKDKELRNWIENDVFESVENLGQCAISVRWVITEKIKGGKIVTKARLVARGYEENKQDLQTNSPTCSREAVRTLLAVASSNQWNCHTIYVQAPYL